VNTLIQSEHLAQIHTMFAKIHTMVIFSRDCFFIGAPYRYMILQYLNLIALLNLLLHNICILCMFTRINLY